MKINEYLRVKTVEEAYHQMIQDPIDSYLIAGGAWTKLTIKEVQTLIDLQDVVKNHIEIKGHMVHLGAMTSLEQIAHSTLLDHHALVILKRAASIVMAPGVRNLATIGGSVMGKYAFSDIIPALLALHAILVFHKRGNVWLQDFLQEPKKDPDILLEVLLPIVPGVGYFHAMKKTALDFSIISVAIVKTNQRNTMVIGSRPGIANRCLQAEQLLNEADIIDEPFLEEVANKACSEVDFGTNVRASGEYRKQIAKVYVLRGLKEVYGL
ncbi:MAG: FAD binding domain-containing protein [Candidatus Izemoplasmatales bacterium]|nr:FAD binding domain-containing protein [bacterium]MDZ4195861.1 FAD binding domain-containing protein [Candidatus Izemoplasmatales bacterium]